MNSRASSLVALALALGPGVARAEEAAPAEAASSPNIVGVPAIPLPPPAVFPSLRDDPGLHRRHPPDDGRIELRDARGMIRIRPSARVSLDLHASPGASDPSTNEAASQPVGPSFFVRRAVIETSGTIGRRLAFTVGVELGGGRIGTTTFRGPDTERVAMASAHSGRLLPADALVTYHYRRWLRLTAGQQLLPFSLSNRTPEVSLDLSERPLAIRGFAVPWHRDVGLTAAGDAGPSDAIHYELGVFGGDGYEHVFADTTPEFAGRVTTRPFTTLGRSFALAGAQLGVSARIGSRDPARVAYDYPTVASAQGWVFWQPGSIDTLGRITHVLPSGLQRALGGELRLPFDLPGGRALDVQTEAVYVDNGTREAVDGHVTTHTERFGRLRGVGWYGQLSFWALGAARANEGGGMARGLQLLAVASGIHATYDSAAREGSIPDPNSPRSDLTVYQFGGALQFWLARNFRAGVHYSAYVAPEGGTTHNLAMLPGQRPGRSADASGSAPLHELSLRLAAGF